MSSYNYDRPEMTQKYEVQPKNNTPEERSWLQKLLYKVFPFLSDRGQRVLESEVRRRELENKKLEAEIDNINANTYSKLTETTIQHKKAMAEMKSTAELADKMSEQKQANLLEKISNEELALEIQAFYEKARLLKLKYGFDISLIDKTIADNEQEFSGLPKGTSLQMKGGNSIKLETVDRHEYPLEELDEEGQSLYITSSNPSDIVDLSTYKWDDAIKEDINREEREDKNPFI